MHYRQSISVKKEYPIRVNLPVKELDKLTTKSVERRVLKRL